MLGKLQIVVNMKFRYQTNWTQLTYSMAESSMRINKKSEKDKDKQDDQLTDSRFNFDQVERHTVFMDYIRNKNWLGVRSYLDDHHIDLFYESMVIKKRKKVVKFLIKLFENCGALVLSSPFIYRVGTTRGSLLSESLEIPPQRVLEAKSDSETDSVHEKEEKEKEKEEMKEEKEEAAQAEAVSGNKTDIQKQDLEDEEDEKEDEDEEKEDPVDEISNLNQVINDSISNPESPDMMKLEAKDGNN